jgi:hypothetical protein
MVWERYRIIKTYVGGTRFVRPKRWYLPTRRHEVTSQFAVIFILTAARTWNLTVEILSL